MEDLLLLHNLVYNELCCCGRCAVSPALLLLLLLSLLPAQLLLLLLLVTASVRVTHLVCSQPLHASSQPGGRQAGKEVEFAGDTYTRSKSINLSAALSVHRHRCRCCSSTICFLITYADL